MFRTIFTYELKYWLKQPSVYIYLLFFLGVSILAMMGALGAFDPPVRGSNVAKENSALAMFTSINYLTILIYFLLPAIIGNSVYRDYKSNMHFILYSYPFAKRDYLFAKFFSALIVVLIIVATIGVGIFIGTQMPGIQEVKLAPFSFMTYAQIYFLFLIPNLFLYGAIVFGVVTFSRNVYAGFITVGLLLFIPQLILNIPMPDMLLCLLDPFGEFGIKYYTKDWTLAQQNELLLPVKEGIIYNRLLWFSISVIVFGWVYKTFSFNQTGAVTSLKRIFTKKQTNGKITVRIPSDRVITQNIRSSYQSSTVQYDFSRKQQLKTLWKLSNIDFFSIIRSWPFITILLAGFVVVIFLLLQMKSPFENEILPVTWLILTFPVLFYSLVVKILSFLYTGIVIQRGNTSRMSPLIDTTPIPNWVFLGSKFLAIVKMQFVLQVAVMIAGICIQTAKGFYAFDLGHYIYELLVIQMIGYTIWAMLAMLVHTIIKNVYLGLFILLGVFFGVGILPNLGITNPLFLFNSNGTNGFMLFTDMHGFGHKMVGFFAYQGYWFVGGCLLIMTTFLLWNRGTSKSLMTRVQLFKKRFTGVTASIWVGIALLFVTLGCIFYYETEVRNPAITNETLKMDLAAFEKEFSAFAKLQQPKIGSVYVEMDIFPASNTFKAAGHYSIINTMDKPLDTLLIRTGYDEHTRFDLDVKYQITQKDSSARFSVVVLDQSVAIGDSLRLDFEMENMKNTLFQTNSSVEAKSTFIKTDAFPRLGYSNHNVVLQSPEDADLRYGYTAKDADLISFEAIVSTSSDQTALTTGTLQREWTEANRNFFHYKMEEKIDFSFAFNSSAYAVYTDQWKDVAIQIYHHQKHDYSLQNMVAGVKAALQYGQDHLTPYQFKEVRIVEFPLSFGSYATVVGNTIPFSEVRFLADTTDDNFDLPFYVAAHEMGHQWWGNQVIPANALGYSLLTESPAEYMALKIYEKTFGKEPIRRYLAKYHEQYLSVRKRENKEKPLQYTDGSRKIPYIKGGMALYNLAELLGEQQLNAALSKYLHEVRYQTKPYTTAPDFVNALKEITPDSLSYFITDTFESVTYYEHTIHGATMYSVDSTTFGVKIDLEVLKKRNSTADQDENLPISDYIEIVVYGLNDSILHRQKHKISEERSALTILVHENPIAVAVDPFHLGTNKNAKTNRITLVTKN